MNSIVLVALGGSLGAVLRYGMAQYIGRWPMAFPLSTFLINLTGSIAMGVLQNRYRENPQWILFIGVGILGAYTTFSTFSFETWNLIRDQKLGLALCYSLGSVGAGVLGVALAWKLLSP